MGIVVMFKINSGGGGPRVVVDLIKALNNFGYGVYFFSPWKLDFKKIEELFEPITIKKEYFLSTQKNRFCIEPNLSRKLMRKEFIKMAEDVDFIIDIDGGILHDYLPRDRKYIIWRISGIEGEESVLKKYGWKIRFKKMIKDWITPHKNTLSKEHGIYAVDDWTNQMLKDRWYLDPQKLCLYPAIKTKDILYKPSIKKNQAIILGRISPNKMIDESIRIFARGAKDSDYTLKIVGGLTPDSEDYKKNLEEIAKEEGILQKIEFVGNPSFDELRKKVEESRILIESQREISLTMTSIECLAAGVVVLVHKNGGTFREVLEQGKYGVGFESIEEGSEKLRKIIQGLEQKKINPHKFIHRAEFFSEENFQNRLKTILKENDM